MSRPHDRDAAKILEIGPALRRGPALPESNSAGGEGRLLTREFGSLPRDKAA